MDKDKLEFSSVRKLIVALNKLIELKASNLEDFIQQKDPDLTVTAKEWDNALKIIDKMPNLEAFEKIANGTSTAEGDTPSETNGNSFEERSKKIKEKLNGATKVSTKAN